MQFATRKGSGHVFLYNTILLFKIYGIKKASVEQHSQQLISPCSNYWFRFEHIIIFCFGDTSTSEDVVCWSNKTVLCCSNLISKTKTMSPALLFCSVSLCSVLLMSFSLSSGPIMQHVLSHLTTFCFSNQCDWVNVCLKDCVYECKCVCVLIYYLAWYVSTQRRVERIAEIER